MSNVGAAVAAGLLTAGALWLAKDTLQDKFDELTDECKPLLDVSRLAASSAGG
jgi:hypothetical protein